MILVTGGAGYIGSHVVKLLGEKGREMVILDNLSRGHREMIRSGVFLRADLSEAARLVEIMKAYRVDAVIHFAGDCLVGESEEDPHKYYRNNVAHGINLLGAMIETGVRRVVFSSSAAVYGEPAKVPIPEDHPTEPTNVYGRTKLVFEHMLRNYDRAYGLRFAALRYFNAAGADESGLLGEDHDPESHLIPIVLDVALGRRREVTIFGTDYATPDGTCVRDYIHVNDLARAHILALEALEGRGSSAVYNLGNGTGFSVREVIGAVEEVTGRLVAAVEGGRRKGDPAVLVASSERIIRELGWRPAYGDLKVIVETAWNFHRRRFG